MNLSTPRQGERGAAALSLLTVGIIVALGIFAVIAAPLSNAGDAKARSRTAADAAALAGAEHIKLQLRETLESLTGGAPTSLETLLPLEGSRAEAQEFAARNDGTLVAYVAPDPGNGWVARATVRGRDVDGQVNRSNAAATLDFPSCSSREEEPPPPPPEEDEDEEDEGDEDEEPPPPPPPLDVNLSCSVPGGGSVGIDLTEGDISLTDDWDDFVEDLLDLVGDARLIDAGDAGPSGPLL